MLQAVVREISRLERELVQQPSVAQTAASAMREKAEIEISLQRQYQVLSSLSHRLRDRDGSDDSLSPTSRLSTFWGGHSRSARRPASTPCGPRFGLDGVTPTFTAPRPRASSPPRPNLSLYPSPSTTGRASTRAFSRTSEPETEPVVGPPEGHMPPTGAIRPQTVDTASPRRRHGDSMSPSRARSRPRPATSRPGRGTGSMGMLGRSGSPLDATSRQVVMPVQGRPQSGTEPVMVSPASMHATRWNMAGRTVGWGVEGSTAGLDPRRPSPPRMSPPKARRLATSPTPRRGIVVSVVPPPNPSDNWSKDALKHLGYIPQPVLTSWRETYHIVGYAGRH